MVGTSFDRFAEEFSFWAEHAHPKRYDEILDGLVVERVERALDLGCGPGLLARWLSPRCRLVVGIDRSPAMIRIASRGADRAGCANVTCVVGDAAAPPFADASFDLVISDTMLHDTAMDRTLPAIRALVRPGGRAILRDIITHDKARARSVAWQALGTLRSVPGYLRRLGPAVTLRILRFELSREWLRHRAGGGELMPDEFEDTCTRFLPGCRFVRQHWFTTACWERPS